MIVAAENTIYLITVTAKEYGQLLKDDKKDAAFKKWCDEFEGK